MSLRSRVVVAMALVALVLIGVAAIVTRSTSTYLLDRLDDQLRSAAPRSPGNGERRRPLDLADVPSGRDGTANGTGADGTDNPLSTFYVGVVRNGVLYTVARPSFGTSDQALPEVSAEQATTAAANDPGQPFTVPATDGSASFRVLASPAGRSGDTLVVALSLEEVEGARNRLVLMMAVGIGLVLAVLGLVAWWVIRLGVRPVKEMTATASAIAAGDLSQRVEPGAPGTEAGELAAALNIMLGRIEESFAAREQSEDRLRRFVADASHELRTPVTSIRGYAELYQRGALDDPESLDQAMRRTGQEAIRMGRLIDDLLLLARLDQGRPLERHRVDLAALVGDAVLDARAVDPERSITTDVTPGLTVVGDDHRLHQVVANLLTNAIRHSPSTADVHVGLHGDGARAVLEVHDDGPGMAPDVATHAFQRFYRADPSRSRGRGGSGLGLSIVQAIVESHGGRVALDTAPGRGTIVRVELPLGPATTVGSAPVGQLVQVSGQPS